METLTHPINKSRTIGISLVLVGTTLWGVSGTVAQYLFQQKGYSAEWLVVVRLLISGLLLLIFATVKGDSKPWAIWKSRSDRFGIILFGIIGMLGVQYTYFAAIEAGNAATATLLQYLGPVFITLYLAAKLRRLPTKKQVTAIILAMVGTYLLVTKGSMQELSISGIALFWGLASAVALAYYTLQPIQLLNRWGTVLVVGWGMLIGGIGMGFVFPPWNMEGEISITSLLAICFVILFGTLVAFYCYLESLKYLQPSETALLGCAEPLSAAFLSVIWLGVAFGVSEWLGAVFIMLTITILARTKHEPTSIKGAA